MGIKQLYKDNLRKLPNEYGGVSVMSTYDFMGVKYSKMFIQIKTLRGLEIIARWGPLPIRMVLRLKSEMLSLARTSKYVNNTSV